MTGGESDTASVVEERLVDRIVARILHDAGLRAERSGSRGLAARECRAADLPRCCGERSLGGLAHPLGRRAEDPPRASQTRAATRLGSTFPTSTSW